MPEYAGIFLDMPQFVNLYIVFCFVIVKTCKETRKSFPIFVKLLIFNRSALSCMKSLSITC